MKLFALVMSLSIFFSTPSLAGELEVDRGRVFIGLSEFNLVVDGETQGRWSYRTTVVGDTLVFDDETTWPVRDTAESTRVVVDGRSLAPRSLHLEGKFDGTTLNADLEWDGNSVNCVYLVRRPGDEETTRRDFSKELATLAYERTSMFGLLTGVDLQPGQTLDISWFNVFAGDIEMVPVKVGDPQTISTPAGSFEVLPVTLESPSQPNVVYLTTKFPRQIVRVDVTGQPMIFELTSTR